MSIFKKNEGNVALLSYFNQRYTAKKLIVLYFCTLLVRALVFGFFVQHEQRYWQSDSEDYHYCARGIDGHNFMVFRGQPLFWRTPGFPLLLASFYWLFGATDNFADNYKVHTIFIWFQIVLTSCIPILLFFLAYSLTGNLIIAWLAAWIAVFHVGFVLASCYVLSDAIALIFFILFLLFFYKSFVLMYEGKLSSFDQERYLKNSCYAALFLALYTWIRPNGQFVLVVALCLLLVGGCCLSEKIKKMGLFLVVFLLLISPWCFRNHRLTGHWFYCSMSGPVLQAFTLPKVMRHVTGKDLRECFAYYMSKATQELDNEWRRVQSISPHLYVSRELVCKKFAHPLIFAHPLVFMYEWFKEVIKTTFDLYSSQIVYMLRKEHKWDPLEEHLSEKIMLCLYGQPMSWLLRVLMWFEFIFSFLVWIGIFAGLWAFLLWPIKQRFVVDEVIKKNAFLWLKGGFMIGSLLVMTGGFGYARLRLPIDPLLIILSLVFWYWFIIQKKKYITL